MKHVPRSLTVVLVAIGATGVAACAVAACSASSREAGRGEPSALASATGLASAPTGDPAPRGGAISEAVLPEPGTGRSRRRSRASRRGAFLGGRATCLQTWKTARSATPTWLLNGER